MNRYEKYKDSGIPWIGEIPQDWDIRKVTRIFSKIGSGTTPQSGNNEYYADKGENWLQTGDLNDSYIYNTSKKLTRKALIECSLRLYPEDSIVMAMYGATIGKLGLLKIPTTTNQACCVMSESPVYCSRYGFNVFLSARNHILNLAYGGGQPNISQDTIKGIRLPVPSIDEQRAIADFLDVKCAEVDELIGLQEQMIDELKVYKQSVITEAVTKGLNPDALLKYCGIRGIDKIPVNWSILRFFQASWIRARLGWKGLKAEEYTESGYPFLSAFNIVQDMLSWNELNYISKDRYNESPEIRLSIGDILLVKDGAGIGKCARIDELPRGESTVNSSLAVITPNPKMLFYKYLYWCLKSSMFQNVIMFLKNGMGVPHLTHENMKNISIPAPSIIEQQQIADYLDQKCAEIDEMTNIKQQKIEQLKEYKKSIIYEYVTGKKQVNIE